MKVPSYNIHMGGGDRLPAIAAIIRGRRPDAVALLEAASRANTEALARGLAMDLAFGEASNGIHVAWLSRLPIRRWENHNLAALAKTLLAIEVVWEDAPLHLFATHLASRHDASLPEEEILAILDLLRPLADQPHLLVGDLNALRPGDPIGTPTGGVTKWGDAADGAPRHTIKRILDAGYVDCYRALHPLVPGYTYPSGAPWMRLDYAFASPPLATCLRACDLVAGREAASASDHLPIWAEFG